MEQTNHEGSLGEGGVAVFFFLLSQRQRKLPGDKWHAAQIHSELQAGRCVIIPSSLGALFSYFL